MTVSPLVGRAPRGKLPVIQCICGLEHKMTADMLRRAAQSYVDGTGAKVTDSGVVMMCVIEAIDNLTE